MLLETKDLILKKAVYEDWKGMYKNVWSSAETAQFMEWRVTTSEEDAKARIERTIQYQKEHTTYLVYEKESGQPIGFAGVEEVSPHIFWETGIALGPRYTGKGYGKQILLLLLEYARALGGTEFYYASRKNNNASKALARSCGFEYCAEETRVDPRNNERYVLEKYCRRL